MKLLLVEFYCWHDECLYTTCQLLKKSNVEVVLALNEDIKSRTQSLFEGLVDEVRYYPFRKGAKGLKAIWNLYRYLLKGGFTHIYFNTASGSEALKFFMLPLPRRIKTLGTLHNVAKLTSSFGQKMITRCMDGYVLLNEILKERYSKLCKLPVAVLYPIIYPKIDVVDIEKPDGEMWIAVPGAVSLSRRDYLSLIPQDGAGYNKSVKFIILGNRHKADGNVVYSKVCEAGVQDNFIFFDAFVPDDIFYAYIQKCDYLMPLVHPDKEVYAKYLTDKISGTYNLAFAYKKPMLCPQEMAAYEDFKDSSLFYSRESFVDFVNGLSAADASEFYKLKKWNADAQRSTLMDFIAALK